MQWVRFFSLICVKISRGGFLIIFYHIFIVAFRDAFAKLLSSGDLTEKYSSQFTTVDSEIAPILAKICFFNHFSGEYLKTVLTVCWKLVRSHHLSGWMLE